jgi:glycosyltransferase involved in cell wall biosynthesis
MAMRSSGDFGTNADRNQSKPRLAIVSTYDELCGIAGYTRALEAQLAPYLSVEVFDLDQYLLRSPHRRVQRLADAHIQQIADRLTQFDSVNIQLEHGTLGRTPAQILRRFRRLTAAAPALSVTFHTILDETITPAAQILRQTMRLKLGQASASMVEALRNRYLAHGVYRTLARQQWHKPVSVITHTRRDMRLLRDVHRIAEAHHHPLAFIAAEQAKAIRARASRTDFPLLRRLPAEAKLIGTFGFLSPYKGFETALEAMRYLPEDHHLLVFGGIHPQAIARHQPVDPYIARLLQKGHIGQSVLDTLRAEGGATSLALDGAAAALLERHPRDLHDRVHFMGVLDDAQFATAMALCDTVVMPYLEVGQSSSGPLAMAVDMGCRVIASRTRAFLQFARYHPGRVEFFDIGNFAELARRIEAGPPAPPSQPRSFDAASNAALYLRVSQPGRRGTPAAPLPAPAPEHALVEA